MSPDSHQGATEEMSPSSAVQALVASVLGSAGRSELAWRESAYERARSITRGAPEAAVREIGSLPEPLAQLVDDVARAPHRITDQQFEGLYAAGYSAEVLYELVVATAVGAGVERRAIGMEAIDGWEAGAGDQRGTSK